MPAIETIAYVCTLYSISLPMCLLTMRDRIDSTDASLGSSHSLSSHCLIVLIFLVQHVHGKQNMVCQLIRFSNSM